MDAIWKKRLSSHPLVVLDWGYIRSMRKEAGPMPKHFNYVVPEVALLEAATVGHGSPVAMMRKLLNFVKQNHERTFVASHLRHFMDAEPKPGKLADRLLVAHAPFFESAEQAQSFTPTDLENKIALFQKDNPYAGIEREFEAGRSKFALSMQERAAPLGNLGENDPADFDKIVIRPETAGPWASLFQGKYGTPQWQRALRVFPDRHAAGRWWRIALWYWLRAARGEDAEDMRNDWSDSVYVFTASYADQFWTADKGAAHVVRLLFKGTSVVLRRPQEIPALH